jgi:hypothetical protein
MTDNTITGDADGGRGRTGKSRSDVARERAAWRDTLPVAVVLALALTVMVVTDTPGRAPGALVWSALVLAVAALVVRAEVRSLRRADEYQRTVALEALAVGFAATLLLLIVVGLLAAAGLMDAGQGLQVGVVGGVLAWQGTRAVRALRA